MPDLDVRPDPLADAFATFRAEAPLELFAPGSSTAHRTVQRRRTASVIAAVVSVAAVATFGVAELRRPTTVEPTAALPSATATATTTTTATTTWITVDKSMSDDSSRALSYLGGPVVYSYDDLHGNVPSIGLPDNLLYGADWGPKSDNGLTISGLIPAPAGVYQIYAACIGVGTVTLTWTTGTLTVPCGSAPIPASAPIALPLATAPRGVLDRAAAGRSGFAWVIADTPLSADQLSQLRESARTVVNNAPGLRSGYLSASGTLDRPRHDSGFRRLTSGAYTVDFVCTGSGEAGITINTGGHAGVKQPPVACDGVRSTIRLTVPSTESIAVDVQPAAGALGHAAYAYTIQQDAG